jgi:hypothetical protein
MSSEVIGRITIAQEDRIRVMDRDGRGYLFVVRKGGATLPELERWRDGGSLVLVSYQGIPDAGAVATSVKPLGLRGSSSRRPIAPARQRMPRMRSDRPESD